MAEPAQKNTHNEKPEQVGVWLVIEITTSILDLDRQGVAKKNQNGELISIPDEKRWRPLMPGDVPEWLKSEQAIRDMVDGQRLCLSETGAGHWYRAITCHPAATETVN